jgi:hypothetical protein
MAKLSFDEIEGRYGITSREMRNAIQDGHLQGERNHGAWLVTETSLRQAIDQGILKNRKGASVS